MLSLQALSAGRDLRNAAADAHPDDGMKQRQQLWCVTPNDADADRRDRVSDYQSYDQGSIRGMPAGQAECTSGRNARFLPDRSSSRGTNTIEGPHLYAAVNGQSSNSKISQAKMKDPLGKLPAHIQIDVSR